MSIFPFESIREYAASAGIQELTEEGARLLAADLEYRLRELIQDASKFAFHARRERMMGDDITKAFLLRRVEPIYGYDPKEGFNFVAMAVKKHENEKTVFYLPEKTVDLASYLQSPAEPFPLLETLTAHWISVEDIQPKIPENIVDDTAEDSATITSKAIEREEVRESALKKPLVQHVLSRELQIYFDAVEEAVQSGARQKVDVVAEAVLTDAGIQQLVPYFVQMISDTVTKNIRYLAVLEAAMRLAGSIIANRHLCIEPYLHQLLPSILTCILGKSLCSEVDAEDHWTLRRCSAELCAVICRQYGSLYPTMQVRVVRTLQAAFSDTGKPLTSHYGAVYALHCLGQSAVDFVVLPRIVAYVKLLNSSAASVFKDRLLELFREVFDAWKAERTTELTAEQREIEQALARQVI